MQTQSEQKSGAGRQKSDWAADSGKPRRSVFSNFKSEIRKAGELETSLSVESRLPLTPSDVERANRRQSVSESDGVDVRGKSVGETGGARNSRERTLVFPLPLGGGEGQGEGETNKRISQTLQSSIDIAVARAFLYQFLARAFEDPVMEIWGWLTDADTHAAFQSAVRAHATGSANLEDSATALTARLRPDCFELFQIAYVTAFGHAARGDCPLNEIEYGDLKADPLFQPHRLADLAAFYRAFGLEVAEAAAERPDHIGTELEFMSVLAAKEAYAHEHQFDDDQRALCRDAQKKFLREHLGRWSPAFARRLARAATDEALAALANFTRDFIAADCARFGLTAGSEDLLLRPVDGAAESLCASCGLQNLPPGAAAPCATT